MLRRLFDFFGVDRAAANISALQWLVYHVVRNTPETVFLHVELCNGHGVRLAKQASKRGSRLAVALCSFTRLLRSSKFLGDIEQAVLERIRGKTRRVVGPRPDHVVAAAADICVFR